MRYNKYQILFITLLLIGIVLAFLSENNGKLIFLLIPVYWVIYYGFRIYDEKKKEKEK